MSENRQQAEELLKEAATKLNDQDILKKGNLEHVSDESLAALKEVVELTTTISLTLKLDDSSTKVLAASDGFILLDSDLNCKVVDVIKQASNEIYALLPRET